MIELIFTFFERSPSKKKSTHFLVYRNAVITQEYDP